MTDQKKEFDMRVKPAVFIEQLVPEALLARSSKILFLTHLAIGDFTYQQNFFRAFGKKYPHIKVDVLIDEVRRTRQFWRWKYLKKYVLLDWVEQSGIFNNIYAGTYSWSRFKLFLRKAQAEEYPIVVSMCTLRAGWYAECARKIAPKGFVAAIVTAGNAYKSVFKKVDVQLRIDEVTYGDSHHITDVYTDWFNRLFDLDVSKKDQFPFVDIPRKWLSYSKLKFVKWGIGEKGIRDNKVIFVNIFAKDIRRCWPLDRLVELIIILQQGDAYEGAYFVINVIPEFYDMVKAFLGNYYLNRVFLFTANENFFQLPAVLSLCDLIISVETSVIHLASALNVPVVALMRSKNPEWAPYDSTQSRIVFAKKRRDWVEDISLNDVIKVTQSFD